MLIVHEYFRLNKMTINISKTQFINMRAPNKKIPSSSFNFMGFEIQESKSVKYLGLYITNTLQWNEHIGHIIGKISPVVGILSKLRRRLPGEVRRLIYFSLIHSHLNYLVEVWGTRKCDPLKRIQVLQNRSLKAVYGLDRLFSTFKLYSTVGQGILPIAALHYYQVALWVYKIKNRLHYSNLNFTTTVHNHDVRSRMNLVSSAPRTNYGKQRIKILGPKIFNTVPIDIRNVDSISQFKLSLKTWLSDSQQLKLFIR